MGAWGYESCSNDDCWDNLQSENIFYITQQEADDSLTKVFAKKQDPKHESTGLLQTQLGVVIWALRHGLIVQKEYLDKGKEIAESLLNNKEYLNEWGFSDNRVEHLKREISDISKAANKGGAGTETHIPGLMENIANRMEAAAK